MIGKDNTEVYLFPTFVERKWHHSSRKIIKNNKKVKKMLLPFHFFTLKLTEFLVEYSFPDKNHSSCKSVDHKTRKQLYKKKKIRTGHKVLNLLIAFPTPFLAHRASKGLMGKFTELPIGIFPLTICPCIFFLSIY